MQWNDDDADCTDDDDDDDGGDGVGLSRTIEVGAMWKVMTTAARME